MADTDDDAGQGSGPQGSGPPDGRRRRPPPTIDVTAVEVPVEGAAAASSAAAASASAPPPGARSRTPWFAILAAGTLGAGLAVLAGGAAWVYFAPLDDHGTDQLTARRARLERSTAVPPAAPDRALTGRLAAVEAAMKRIAEHVADLDRQNGDNASAVREARERSEAVAKAMADVNRADADQDKRHQGAQEELAGLNRRFDAVEALVKAIRDQVAESAAPKADEPLRFALVAAGLRFALERGEPFTAELAAAKAVGIDPVMLAGVAPFAATGVPNPPELFRELTGLVPEMLKASAPAAQEDNYLDRLQAHAQRLVRIRPAGDRPGDDAAAVIGRIDRDMARRDLASVLAELDKLPAPAQAIAEPWRKKALARPAASAPPAQLVALSFARLRAPAGAPSR